MTIRTEQERFWEGEFGDQYRGRNRGRVPTNIALFAHILAHTQPGSIQDVLELGAGDGQNLEAIHALLPDADLTAVEINERTAREIPIGDIICASAADFTLPPDTHPELVFTKGLLIHVAAKDRPAIYDRMYNSTSRYLLICEYYAPHEVEIEYRGHAGKLWRADFAGEIQRDYRNLIIVARGIALRTDTFPQDDLTWYLMEKT